MEKSAIRSNLVYVVILLITTAVLLSGSAVFSGMKAAVDACLCTMIPSLYAMMICSELFISSGLAERIARIIRKPAGLIFGAGGQVLVIFLFSQAAGYPVGTRMICRLYDDGQLSRRQASWLSGACCGGGPAFLSALFADNSHHALLIFAAGFISNLLIFTVMCRLLRMNDLTPQPAPENDSSGTGLVQAASSSGAALLKICAMVIVFGGITGLLEGFGADRLFPDDIYKTILGFAEISRITGCFPYASAELPVLGAMLSFGGICVLMQIHAVTAGRLDIKCIITVRTGAALLTWLQLFLWQRLFASDEAIHTAVTGTSAMTASAASPLPSLLLVVMTIMLLRSADRN